jgi:hypothetical protein
MGEGGGVVAAEIKIELAGYRVSGLPPRRMTWSTRLREKTAAGSSTPVAAANLHSG